MDRWALLGEKLPGSLSPWAVHALIFHMFCHLQGTFTCPALIRMRWPKYWSFSFSICPSNEYSGLIFFRIDWFDLLAVQGTLKSLLQHHTSKASILGHSAFFMVQLSHPYMTTGKNYGFDYITLCRQSKVMSLLFNMLCRMVIAFLPRSKCLLISWLQSPSAVILEFKKIKSVTESESHSVMSDSLQPHGLNSPWNSPDWNTGVGSLSVLQGIFPTQGSNPGLPHCRQILYQLSHKGNPRILSG